MSQSKIQSPWQLVIVGNSPGNTNDHCNMQWYAHFSDREDSLVLKDNRDLGECKSKIVRYNAPKQVLRLLISCSVSLMVGIRTFRTSSTLSGKGTNIACFPLPAFASVLCQHGTLIQRCQTYVGLGKHLSQLRISGKMRQYTSLASHQVAPTIANRME